MLSDLTQPALVIVDVQNAIDDPTWGPRNNPNAEQVIASLLTHWRIHEWPIFHVRHDSIEADSPYRPGTPSNDFKAVVAPEPGETIVAKTTNSAFLGTNLDEQLRLSNGVVFVGVLTNNSLEATVRMAGNLGHRTFVVGDACWSVNKTDLRGQTWPAEDVHQLSLANMHGEYATVIESHDVLREPEP